jgi:hypothetical protein
MEKRLPALARRRAAHEWKPEPLDELAGKRARSWATRYDAMQPGEPLLNVVEPQG